MVWVKIPIVDVGHVSRDIGHAPAWEPTVGLGPLARPHHRGEDDGAYYVKGNEGQNQDSHGAEVDAGNGAGHTVKTGNQILN